MKVLALVLAVLLADGLVIGGAFLLVGEGSPDSALFLLAVASLTVFVYGPLILGSITAYWNVRKSPESRKYFAWWLGIVIGLEVLAAVAIVVYAILVEADVWLPIVFVGGGVVLTAVALLVGRWLLRREETHPAVEQLWAPISRKDILRRIRIVVITFAAILVVGMVVFTLLAGLIGDPRIGLSFAVQFAFTAAAIACVLVSLPMNRQLRATVSSDLGRLRKIAKVVIRGKQLELDDDEQVAAAKYSVLISITMPFQMGYLLLIYIAIGIQGVRSLVSGDSSAFLIVLSASTLVLFVAVLVIFFPLSFRQIRHARRYARDHADLLPTAEATPTDQA
ncbi:hypothetical protein [Glaciihabitans sp. UYNi722]|uniref:hypothetical protein n=1 Tax=Glaciihabitans sp. UYNi722 TaxID=3156344 RepID=UPI003396CD20